MAESIYEPLTKPQIRELLVQASSYEGELREHQLAKTLIRLERGIEGMVSLARLEGPVAEREMVLDHTFTEWVRSKSLVTDALVDEIDVIINGAFAEIERRRDAIWNS